MTEAPEGALASAAQAVRMRMGLGGESRRELAPMGTVVRQSGSKLTQALIQASGSGCFLRDTRRALGGLRHGVECERHKSLSLANPS
jgi:hypothetical protein